MTTETENSNVPAAIGCLICVGLLLYAAILFGYQCVLYLQNDCWTALPVSHLFERPKLPTTEAEFEDYLLGHYPEGASALQRSQEYSRIQSTKLLLRFIPSLDILAPQWLSNPHSWLGLHKLIHGMLDDLPIPFSIAIFGIVIAALWFALLDLIDSLISKKAVK